MKPCLHPQDPVFYLDRVADIHQPSENLWAIEDYFENTLSCNIKEREKVIWDPPNDPTLHPDLIGSSLTQTASFHKDLR